MSTYSPYDMVTLTATPRDYLGKPLSGLPPIKYSSTDIERVLVSPDGRPIAVKPTNLTGIVATLTVNNLKHADTV